MRDNREGDIFITEGTLNGIIKAFESKSWDRIAVQDLRRTGTRLRFAKRYSVAEISKIGRSFMASIARYYVNYVCKNDSEARWLHTTARDPFINNQNKKHISTLADRVDAISVLLDNNCVLNWKLFYGLIELTRSDKIRVKQTSIQFLYTTLMKILPSRKLKYIDQIEEDRLRFLGAHLSYLKGKGGSIDECDPFAKSMLLAVSFEDFLKGIYSTFIQILSDMMNSNLEFMQKDASNYCLQMLIQKPEQEVILLDMIISRLGHKNDKMSSYAFNLLDTLLQNHGQMKRVVVAKVGERIKKSISWMYKDMHHWPSKGKWFTRRKTVIFHHTFSLFHSFTYLYFAADELIHMLKGIHRGMHYISRLNYTRYCPCSLFKCFRNEYDVAYETFKCFVDSVHFFFAFHDIGSSKFSAPMYEYEECAKIVRCISIAIEKCLRYFKFLDSLGTKQALSSGKTGIFDDRRKELLDSLQDNVKSLYRAAHRPTSLSANISLLSLLSSIFPSEDRYYNLLYERILDIRMFDASNTLSLLLVVDKMMQQDSDVPRVCSFIKRLLQVAGTITSTNASLLIARICRKKMGDLPSIRKIIHDSPKEGEHYIHDKRNPTYSMADECHLWELYLNAASYNPILEHEFRNLDKDPVNALDQKGFSTEYNTFTLFQELSLFSGALQHGDYSYTQEKYWKNNKQAEPHHMSFKLYHKLKYECDPRLQQKKKLELPQDVADEISDGQDTDPGVEFNDVNDSEVDTEPSISEGDAEDISEEDTDEEISDDVTDDEISESVSGNEEIDDLDSEEDSDSNREKRNLSSTNDLELKKRKDIEKRLKRVTRGSFADASRLFFL
ncbi:conserved hypothetical protein [Theileria equi strain WA]|uniref:CCAAT-binding factor domain-containing protein n=1 Tax=Theileria equi strain WA TaxID=1537102 RepID=L1LDP4_THEEQ|nr:conserved hypothetical protein [Theileria equi strain WA]EKX73572.1 conserved hypothetical protein [Theileria equi strain WA]|eukprot:XP_004833024.1 conserved hypothetical protein [Theileria equi strain WA]